MGRGLGGLLFGQLLGELHQTRREIDFDITHPTAMSFELGSQAVAQGAQRFTSLLRAIFRGARALCQFVHDRSCRC